jgi:hypothetical protein
VSTSSTTRFGAFLAALDVVVATVECGVLATDVGVGEVARAVADGASAEGDADVWDVGSSEASPQPDNNRNAPTTSEPTTTTSAKITSRLERVGREAWPERRQRNIPRS